MVHEFDNPLGEADRLDALWDDLIRLGDSPRVTDAAPAPFLAYLDSLAPRSDSAARARIRQRVFGARQEKIMEPPLSLNHTNGRQPALAASRPQRRRDPRRRSWVRLPMAAMEVTAAFAVLAAIVFGVWMLRPNGGPSLPAASTLSSPASTPRAGGDGGSIASLELDNTAVDTALSVTVQRITLPPNTAWVFDDGTFPSVPVPVSQFVESGTLTVGVRGENHQVTAGNNSKVEGGPQYLLNRGSDPVTFLQLLTHVTGQAAPEPPSAATVKTIAEVPLTASPADTQTIITLNRATFTGADTSVLPAVPNPQTIFLRVETGELRVNTPRDPNGLVLKTGESVTMAEGGITAPEILGDTTATALFINVQVQSNAERVANDPRAGSTVDWQIPDGGGNVGLMLNQLTLGPTAAMTFDLDGAIHIRVVSGAVTMKTNTEDKELTANNRATFAGQSHIAIRNTGGEKALVLLGMVYGEWANAPGITHENRTGEISVTALGTGAAHLSGGAATVSLAPVQTPTELGASSTSYLNEGASLLAMTQGTVKLTKMAGDIEVWHNVSNTSTTGDQGAATPQLGKAVKIGVDNAVLVHPHAGYRVELAGDATNPAPQLFALTVTSTALPSASTPTANGAAPAPSEAFTVAADTPCNLAPRTVDDLKSILNPESATGTPNLGLRDQQATGVLADPATVTGVQQTVRDLAACQSNGSARQTYALYSDNAIRLMAEANNLTAEDLAAEGDDTPDTTTTAPRRGMTIAIGDIVTFPDGRAGATVNFDGELAYLTFVHHGDRWLIDAWDDR